ncbi:MAG: hypothetical protein ABSF44_03055 [Candidatus Bathyarchaeia archaeon]|jgi:hypothetical protein
MFYIENPSKALRFGDILQGYCYTTPIIEEPVLNGSFSKYEISVDFPLFSALMSPCCQIERGTIALSPLIPIRSSIFANPYLADDLTRINKKVTPQQAIPPRAWEAMDEQERQKREAKGLAYAFPYLFVFEKHIKLPEYNIDRQEGNITTGCYMVDFKNITKIACEQIKSQEEAPLESKILELSVETRKVLGDKLASYFGTLAPEDMALLETT